MCCHKFKSLLGSQLEYSVPVYDEVHLSTKVNFSGNLHRAKWEGVVPFPRKIRTPIRFSTASSAVGELINPVLRMWRHLLLATTSTVSKPDNAVIYFLRLKRDGETSTTFG